MNKIYTIDDLPKDKYGIEYTIFNFETICGDTPLALHVGTSADNIVAIIGLDKLDGYFEGDTFYDNTESYNLFINFLKSITIKQNANYILTRYDIAYAKKYFNVELHVV